PGLDQSDEVPLVVVDERSGDPGGVAAGGRVRPHGDPRGRTRVGVDLDVDPRVGVGVLGDDRVEDQVAFRLVVDLEPAAPRLVRAGRWRVALVVRWDRQRYSHRTGPRLRVVRGGDGDRRDVVLALG